MTKTLSEIGLHPNECHYVNQCSALIISVFWPAFMHWLAEAVSWGKTHTDTPAVLETEKSILRTFSMTGNDAASHRTETQHYQLTIFINHHNLEFIIIMYNWKQLRLWEKPKQDSCWNCFTGLQKTLLPKKIRPIHNWRERLQNWLQ